MSEANPQTRGAGVSHEVRGAEERPAVWVLGAGAMGRQIALRCALAGHPVCMIDPSPAALDSALEFQGRALDAAVRRAEITAARARAARDAMRLASEVGEAGPAAAVVIEAIPEDLGMKRQAFRQLDRVCPAHTILATNSSSIAVSRLEDATSRAERVVNTHFYPQLLRDPSIVEVMAGTSTSPEVLRSVAAFVRGLGLMPLMVRRESMGFIFNRVWRAIKKECLRVVAEGVASHEDVDRAWMIAVGTAIGPFGLMDMVGLDVVRDIEMSYQQASGDPSDAPPRVLQDLVERGHLGVKSGEGFYHYPRPAFADPSFLRPTDASEPGERAVRASDLVGTWRLVSWENRYDDGRVARPFGAEALGYLVYTASGHVSVHLMAPGRHAFASPDLTAATAAEAAAAFRTSLCYAGRFALTGDRVLHQVEMCTFPNWVGTSLERVARLAEGRLTLTTAPTPFDGVTGVAALVWERC